MIEKSIVRSTIRVLMPNGRVQEMKLETYLAGAVAMAIGTSAPLEALKAQAVASRTYAARARRHADQTADVCTTAHCQKWKRVDPIVAPGVFRAVSETWGTVAMHEGELIEAFFFEHCAGKTRDAEEMAMPAFPYLRQVDCGCGFTEMKGHGVGMCQRGAIVMARQGGSYKDILQHYYRGVEVIQYTGDAPPVTVASTKKAEKPEPKSEPKKTRAAPKEKKAAPAGNLAKDGLEALIEALNKAAGPFTSHHESTPPPAKPPAAPKPTPAPPPQPPSPEPKTESLLHLPPLPKLHPDRRPLVLPFHGEHPAKTEAPDAEAAATPQAVAAPEPSPPVELPPLPPAEPKAEQVIHVDMLPGPRVIAGCLLHAGVAVEIEDIRGNKTTVYTGSAPHYGEGGFEAPIEADGFYTVNVDGKLIELYVRGETAFLRGEAV